MNRLEFPLESFGCAVLKGTRHEPRPLALENGLAAADRRFALLDPQSGRFLRTVQHGPQLIPVRADFDGTALTVHIPGKPALTAPVRTASAVERGDYWGRQVNYREVLGPFSDVFSDYLGTRVILCEPERGKVIYGSPVSLIFTASLEQLADDAGWPALPAEHARFRATFLAESTQPYIEDTLTGQVISVGGVDVLVGELIPRCAVIDFNPFTGRRDTRLLTAMQSSRPANANREPMFGVFGRVLNV